MTNAPSLSERWLSSISAQALLTTSSSNTLAATQPKNTNLGRVGAVPSLADPGDSFATAMPAVSGNTGAGTGAGSDMGRVSYAKLWVAATLTRTEHLISLTCRAAQSSGLVQRCLAMGARSPYLLAMILRRA